MVVLPSGYQREIATHNNMQTIGVHLAVVVSTYPPSRANTRRPDPTLISIRVM